ncbi:hypothetical protein DER46DRAFT_146019 [Fusarium sp. MPI-SDFR-AT-0072]|nr:hypothetical protein DER46DRAFT_146019 [Fusarium sp. MPI-SDFR-AT-0072]
MMHAIDNLSPLCYHVGSAPAHNSLRDTIPFSLSISLCVNSLLKGLVLTMSSQRASFTSLSNELIAQIFELSHVSDHFNLAMTCRRLNEGGQTTLIRHQKASQEYNLVSDFLPPTMPSVLQKVVRDPYVAWNIRSIEI